ncbi:hypothetical protein Q9233_015769 [Columba guinea]|nr:hypothetical protein Q9233_015769 [Columba guinea]
MDGSSKEPLLEEAPPSYTASHRLPCIPHQLKCLLIVVVVVVVLVVVIVAFLLLGLHITETHAETVLRMTIHGRDGDGTPQQLSMSKKERTGTFAVRDGLNASAMLVYDYGKLLVGYRSWRHHICYVTRMDKDNIPGLDAVTETFQRRQAEMKEVGDNDIPLANRSLLGTTVNILCSTVPGSLGCKEEEEEEAMESSVKQVVVEEPLLLGCTHHLKCLLITVVVVVLLVVIIAGALLMWLRADQRHADAVLWMGMMRGPAWEEDAATFYLDNGDGNPATVIYDYKNLLVSYRSQLHRACYITRVDKDNIPGLDAIAESFQRRQAEEKLALPLADRSLLGTTASILCSIVPVYWA